jgi:RHS repeat-associated protein
VTNQAQQVVWRWENQEPFGKSLPEQNPSGLGAFEFNLRFPGQYFDAETGLAYNYFRDYDPQTGRYVQPDPLGVIPTGVPTSTARLNHLYSYVDAAPLAHADPLGLVKWSGTVLYRGIGPVTFDVYTLTSECRCGYKYRVGVSTKAAGLTRGWAWFGQTIEMEDFQSCPDPDFLAGDYLNVSFGAAGGAGVGFSFTILGGAGSPGSWAWLGGVGASAGGVAGKSTVEWRTRIPCAPGCQN